MSENFPKIDYSRGFLKQLKKATLEIKISFRNRLKLFLTDPLNPLLNNHKLTGQFSGCRSINVTGDWRAIYKEQLLPNEENTVIFLMLGTHSELYKD